MDSTPDGSVARPVIFRQQATGATVRDLLVSSHAGLASFIAHGRDDGIHLQDSMVCARPGPRLADEDMSHRADPVCAITGECFRAEISLEQIVCADTILVDAVFVNACMTWRLNAGTGLFPIPYLVSTGFLRGAAAGYVGAPQVVSGLAKVNEMFHAAIGGGATMGDATSLVNDHLRFEQTDSPYYTLLGLPWAAPLAGVPGSEQAPERFRLERGGAGAAGVVDAAARTLRATMADDLVRHVISVSPRTERVLPGPVLEADASSVDQVTTQLRRLGPTISALETAPLLGLRYSRQNNIQLTLRDQITSLAGALQRSVALGDAAKIKRR